jgi:hypothetical protein
MRVLALKKNYSMPNELQKQKIQPNDTFVVYQQPREQRSS